MPPGLCCAARAIIGGDALCLSIAAASIVAKVARDAMMTRLDAHYPDYGFARHVGYATQRHLEAIARCGPIAASSTLVPARVAARIEAALAGADAPAADGQAA